MDKHFEARMSCVFKQQMQQLSLNWQ